MKKIYLLFSILMSVSVSCDAQRWVELGKVGNSLNANNSIFSILTDPSGNLYAGGGFTEETSDSAYVAFWNGTTWTELGTDTTALHANGNIYSITRDLAGNIYAAGSFTDSNRREYVAQWNGSRWSEIGYDTAGLNATAPIYALATDAAGRIYAAGAFGDQLFSFQNYYYVAVWNGHWSELGFDSLTGLHADSIIYALTFDKQGNLYAAGAFTDSNGYSYVAKWNGSAWSKLGTGVSTLKANGSIRTLMTDSLGNVYAAGNFTDTNGYYYVAKWNGSRWLSLSSPNDQIHIAGPIYTMTLDSALNVYAGGSIPDSSGNFVFIAEWDGSRLTTADNGGRTALDANDAIWAMCSDNHGHIYAAGSFKDAYGAQYVAEFTSDQQVGIATIDSKHLVVYPNPVTSILNIPSGLISSSANIHLIDALGRTVLIQNIDTNISSIDLFDYPAGLYTIIIFSSDNCIIKDRLIKE